jgi:hypothetical protein
VQLETLNNKKRQLKMFERFLQRLSASKKPASKSEPTPLDRFWESDLPTIMLEQEIGRPALRKPTVLPLLTPPQPVRSASSVVGPDGQTAKQRHEARVRAFVEADMRERQARRAEVQALRDVADQDLTRREDIEPRQRQRDFGISL